MGRDFQQDPDRDPRCGEDLPTPARSSVRSSFKLRRYTILDSLCVLCSVGSFLFDTGSDIWVAYRHYKDGSLWYFGLTVAFILVPATIMMCFSFRWYLLDLKLKLGTHPSKVEWCIRAVFHILQLGQVVRYVDTLIYGLKSNRNKSEQREFYRRSAEEDVDASMLRLFECFMEATPQLILQICILARDFPHQEEDFWTVVAQNVSIVTSLVSVAWSLASYNKALRLVIEDKANMRWRGAALYFLWRLFVIVPRVLALGLFASLFPLFMFLVCGVRWLLMSAWIISMKTQFYENRVEELVYNLVLGVVFIFCYLNPVDTPTRYRFVIFYVVTFVENSVLLGIFYAYSPTGIWYKFPAVLGGTLCFVLGIAFMLIYYLLLHPTGNIPVVLRRNQCSPISRLQIKQDILKEDVLREEVLKKEILGEEVPKEEILRNDVGNDVESPDKPQAVERMSCRCTCAEGMTQC
ncbi:XK-related protein 4 [Ixodes scapularis]|uniref:XK-related protein 4 n=1 Tax=Ixodes scapularis TaxID=6945 RepID=UPI001A9E013B|nr:XK-related protein 4 [Ixodes scapularis]